MKQDVAIGQGCEGKELRRSGLRPDCNGVLVMVMPVIIAQGQIDGMVPTIW